MKFRVDRDALAEAVSWVARALPTRPVVPVLSGLRLDAAVGGALTLSCFDYEVSATAQIEADVAEPGTVIVPGRLLTEITRNLPALAVDVAAVDDAVDLTCGSAEFTLYALAADEYPALPEPPPVAGTIDGGVLGPAIGQVAPAASRDDTLPMLTGVCLDIDGGTLTLAATDRYRLAVREVPWAPARPGLRAAALVPARTLADAARAMTPGMPVSVAFDTGPEGPAAGGSAPRGGRGGAEPRPADGMISFGMGGRRLTARLIGGEFIRYRSRFPAEFGCRAEVPGTAFAEAVRRVALVADRASPVQLTFRPGSVVVEARTEGRARAVETVPAEFSGDEPGIAFNPHYLLDGLSAAASVAVRHAGEPVGPGQDGAREDGAREDGAREDGAREDGGSPEGAGAVEGSRSAEGSGSAGSTSGAPAPGGKPPEPGLVRIEFTSPAKPALITRVAAAESAAAAAGSAPVPEFRYLVVPLRAVARS
jgi:DNA polymerase-3 subunit beta